MLWLSRNVAGEGTAITSVKDLKGKKVVITTEDSTERLFISSMVRPDDSGGPSNAQPASAGRFFTAITSAADEEVQDRLHGR